jgi:glycosyltransferase involved in cell wall biosynthesis
MKIDVFMMGLRHIHATQGGIETHVRHLANEMAAQGLNIAIAVRTRDFVRSRRQTSGGFQPKGQRNGEDIGTGFARWHTPTETGTGLQSPLSPTAADNNDAAGTIRIVPIWAPRIVALDAILHSLLCVFYAAITRPRIVHIHGIGPGLVTPIACLLGLTVVATHHGQDYQREKWGLVARAALRLGEWMQAKFATAIICVSRSLRDTLKNRYHRNYIYVPNGVHAPRELSSLAPLESLGLTPGAYILSVGRLVPEKRHGDLIDAFVAAEKIPDLKLVIVGEGKSRYADWLKRKAANAPNVVMAGYRGGKELEALYANALVFALPSSHEGLPIVLLEAMAHGCEIIVSDIAPHRELGFTSGRYHGVGDVPSLSARISNVALRGTLKGERCDWSSLLHHYRWSSVAQKTVEIFGSVDSQIGPDASGVERRLSLPRPRQVDPGDAGGSGASISKEPIHPYNHDWEQLRARNGSMAEHRSPDQLID